MNTLKDDIVNRAKAKIQREISEIENRQDLTQAQKISQIIHIFSAICAGLPCNRFPLYFFTHTGLPTSSISSAICSKSSKSKRQQNEMAKLKPKTAIA